MALHVEFLDLSTGEILQLEDLDLTEQQMRWVAEYQEWDQTRRICQQNMLPLGIKEAYRKMDFIARDFAWTMTKRRKWISIRTPDL